MNYFIVISIKELWMRPKKQKYQSGKNIVIYEGSLSVAASIREKLNDKIRFNISTVRTKK